MEEYIKINIEETETDRVDCIQLAEDRIQRRALVNNHQLSDSIEDR
jgi:hypothetical protein